MAAINALPEGRVLEVGVGTGISLPHYRGNRKIVGIDLSPDMLKRAEARVRDQKLTHVEQLAVMDAGDLKFADGVVRRRGRDVRDDGGAGRAEGAWPRWSAW